LTPSRPPPRPPARSSPNWGWRAGSRWLSAKLPGAAIERGPFDVVWASHVVHHLPDESAAVRELATSLRPGGRLALAEGGVHLRCLPSGVGLGEPGLEGRLDAAGDRWFAALRARLPGAVPRRRGWTRLLGDAGLVEVGTRSFLLELGPPLTATQAAYVRHHLRGLVARLDDELDPVDRQALVRLTDPDHRTTSAAATTCSCSPSTASTSAPRHA
jgi:SAM-dependent methyltransferase